MVSFLKNKCLQVKPTLTLKTAFSDKAKLICWSMGPTDPILNKQKKITFQTFGQLVFFDAIIFCFLKQKEIKHRKLI